MTRTGLPSPPLALFLPLLLAMAFLASPCQAQARTLDEIVGSGAIVIGIRDYIPPIQYRDAAGELVGIDPDLGREIARELGVTVTWKILEGPKFRVPVLEDNEVDLVISSFSVTPDRLQKVSFSDGYFETGLAIMIRSEDMNAIRSWRDLSGKTVTSTQGSTGADLIGQHVPDANFLFVTATADTYKALENGAADALINDRVFLDAYASSHPGFHVLPGTLSADTYAVGVNRNNPTLLTAVNKALASIRAQGTLDAIIKRYTGQAPQEVETSSTAMTTHTVGPGDTLSGIALRYYNDMVHWPQICEANKPPIRYCNIIEVGWELTIPELASQPPAVHATPSAPTTDQPAPAGSVEEKLRELKNLYDKGYITKEIYEEKQRQLLDQL